MSYKELLNKTLRILSSPGKTWIEINKEEEIEVLRSFVYPMMTLCGLALLIGMIFDHGWSNISLVNALTTCCSLLVSLLGGFFLSSYLVNMLGHRIGNRPANDMANCKKLVGYSMSVIFILEIFNGLFPSFIILRWILQFYTVYLVWEGAKNLMNIPEKVLLTYTLINSAVILISPILVGNLFNSLSKVFN